MVHGEPRVPQVAQGLVEDDNLLLLTGPAQQTVNVSVIGGVPMFSLPASPEQQYIGMKWQANGYALMVTFAFQSSSSSTAPSIRELVPTTPGLWFSETFPDSSWSNQIVCIPSTFGEYHFKVEIKDGPRLHGVDPKVVVTPIIT